MPAGAEQARASLGAEPSRGDSASSELPASMLATPATTGAAGAGSPAAAGSSSAAGPAAGASAPAPELHPASIPAAMIHACLFLPCVMPPAEQGPCLGKQVSFVTDLPLLPGTAGALAQALRRAARPAQRLRPVGMPRGLVR